MGRSISLTSPTNHNADCSVNKLINDMQIDHFQTFNWRRSLQPFNRSDFSTGYEREDSPIIINQSGRREKKHSCTEERTMWKCSDTKCIRSQGLKNWIHSGETPASRAVENVIQESSKNTQCDELEVQNSLREKGRINRNLTQKSHSPFCLDLKFFSYLSTFKTVSSSTSRLRTIRVQQVSGGRERI